MSYRLMLFHCFDPPEPPEECKHGVNRHHFCERCDDEKPKIHKQLEELNL